MTARSIAQISAGSNIQPRPAEFEIDRQGTSLTLYRELIPRGTKA